MLEKELQKNSIVDQGRELMAVSSEVRSSDIEQKLLRLDDKWQHLVAVMDFRSGRKRERERERKEREGGMILSPKLIASL